MSKVTAHIPSPEDLKVPITFSDGVGVLPENAFLDNAPDGLTAEVFEQVDQFRENFIAGVADQLLDHNSTSGNSASIADLSLGGKTTANLEVSSNGVLLIEQTTVQGPVIAAVMAKSEQLSLSSPVVEPEDEDDE